MPCPSVSTPRWFVFLVCWIVSLPSSHPSHCTAASWVAVNDYEGRMLCERMGTTLEALSRTRRQIIIVTHNANLVVNTDADQVIIASAGAHVPGGLPNLTYLSGGLENPAVRDEVCEILEGGERAFKERARRLRLVL